MTGEETVNEADLMHEEDPEAHAREPRQRAQHATKAGEAFGDDHQEHREGGRDDEHLLGDRSQIPRRVVAKPDWGNALRPT
jgi:hypothetical protein